MLDIGVSCLAGEVLASPSIVEKAALCTTANRVLEKASIRLHQPEASNAGEFSVDHHIAAWRQVTGLKSPPAPTSQRSLPTLNPQLLVSLLEPRFISTELRRTFLTSCWNTCKTTLSRGRLWSSSAGLMGVAQITASVVCRQRQKPLLYSGGCQDLGRWRMCFSVSLRRAGTG